MFSYLCHFHISTFGTCDSPHLKGLEIGNRPGGWDKHIDFPVDQPMGECSKKNFSITSAFVSLVCSCHGFCGFRCHQPHMAYASTQEPNPATIVAQCPGRQSRVDKGERLKVTYFGPWCFFKLLLRFFSTNDCGNLGSRNLFSSVPEQSNGLIESKGWGASTCEVTNIWRARTSTADQGRIPRIWHLDSFPNWRSPWTPR